MSRHRRVLGIELSAYVVRDQYRLVFFGRVQRALELIGRYEPRRLDRIRRDVRTICGMSGGPNVYHHVGRAIMLTMPTVLASSPPELAMVIVHEATHGRIDDRGIPYLAENRSRIETACVRQETIFARRLPGGDALADASVGKLANPWWSDQDLVEWQLRTLKAEEVPPWLARFVERMLKRRAARASRGATVQQ
ncbi:MAG TPA: hypothetical protein VGJ18_03175 [Gemmatimonadaceae bacterium]|jgi:hypothetical protein